jgi:hypothetical protein
VAPTSTRKETGLLLPPPTLLAHPALTLLPRPLKNRILVIAETVTAFQTDECPVDSMPKTEFSEDLLDTLATITLKNPILLSCNPYTKDCVTEPPLEKSEACFAEISKPDDDASQCPEGYSYR